MSTQTITLPHVRTIQACSSLNDSNSTCDYAGELVDEPAIKDFTWTDTAEPHSIRRNDILLKHPEIKSLFVNEPLTCPIVLGLFGIQILMCYLITRYDISYTFLVPLAYAVGGTINHTLQLAVHELSHNLCFQTPLYNKILALISNMPTGVPSAITFQRYHIDHHKYQGYDGIDTDIPTLLEVVYIFNCVAKTIWIICQPLVYAIRPMLVVPKEPTRWEAINWATCIVFNVLIYTGFGQKSFVYLLIGTLLGLGLHPAAGHFIAEHYTLTENHETYSYYSWCNYLNFNVGYHNEHHDFPRIPWSKLPTVKNLAPEYYNTLPHYTSYCYVFYRFITDDNIGCQSRIKRNKLNQQVSYMKNKAAQQTGNKQHIVAVGGITTLFSIIAYIIYSIAV